MSRLAQFFIYQHYCTRISLFVSTVRINISKILNEYINISFFNINLLQNSTHNLHSHTHEYFSIDFLTSPFEIYSRIDEYDVQLVLRSMPVDLNDRSFVFLFPMADDVNYIPGIGVRSGVSTFYSPKQEDRERDHA